MGQVLADVDKIAILVDKVMQREEGWTTKEWIVKEVAEAGFNVFSPRSGYDKPDEVRQVVKWCKEYGLYHMPWMGGTLKTSEGPEADGKRLVWESGIVQPLWSPNSEEFWEWTNGHIVELAKISSEFSNLMGVFIDYENYAPGRSPRHGNCYALSYDEVIMGRFAKKEGFKLPDLKPEERAAWLKGQDLDRDFADFQIGQWRDRCRTLREAVDRYNPEFMFCIYPAPGTLFMREACYREWATEAAPLILADATTYGRSSRLITEHEALEENRKKLLERMDIPRSEKISFVYVGGIDPVVEGADPEFCGKNAVSISQISNGYWVFYEGPEYRKDHPEYFRWFAWANRAIVGKDLDAWHQPRKTHDKWSMALYDDGTDRELVVSSPWTGEKIEHTPVKMRYNNVLFVGCKYGYTSEITIRNEPIFDPDSSLSWELKTPQLEKMDAGSIHGDGVEVIRITPRVDGIHLVEISADDSAYWVVDSNAPVGFYIGGRLRFRFGAERLYFKVQQGVERFIFTVRGNINNTARLEIFDPEGELAATGQTTPKRRKANVEVSVNEGWGKVWSLAVLKADEGILEDVSIQLSRLPSLLPVVSLSPDQTFERKC